VRESEVEQAPLDASRAEDAEGVASYDSEGEQPVGELVDAATGLLPRDRLPDAVSLQEVGGRLAVPGDGVAPEGGNRPPAERGFRADRRLRCRQVGHVAFELTAARGKPAGAAK
jgi:hypothetical protein